jgi:adenylate cyclase
MSEGDRRLAAIMFTDIVGYTALTQRDESRSMRLLQTHNGILRPVFQKFRGREVKTIGDAFLLEFSSALDALICAVSIQEALSNYNRSGVPDSEQMKLRIGIHLGDVIYRDGDVFGDAVNIASRIQPLADPGGICVSEQVYDQVRNKTSYEWVENQQVTLKNVSYPVDVYYVVLPWEPRPKPAAPHGASDAIPIKRRLAILPMANLTQNPQDEYIADGMTEELITALSSVRDMRVIARTSVMRYKGSTKGVSEIAKELNVGSVVEGSILKHDNKIRVKVQLIDGSTEEHLFGTSYDREFQDIFAVQSDIAKQVSKALKAKLRTIEKQRMEKEPTKSLDAYSHYLQGRFALHRRTKDAMREAVRAFERSVATDSRFAKAYAGLADTYLLMGSYGYAEAKESYGKAKGYVSMALDLDEGLAEAHVSLGFLLETYYYDFAAARREFDRAISLSPSYAQARHWSGINFAILGDLERAVLEMEKAQEADPLSAQIATVLGGFYTYLNRNDEAHFQWDKALRSHPGNYPLYLNRGMYFAQAGEKEKALADINKALELSANGPTVKCIAGYVYATIGDRTKAEETLNELVDLSKLEYVSPFYLSMIYAALGRTDECLAAIESSLEDRSCEVESLLQDRIFEAIRAAPRFSEVLKRLGLQERKAKIPQPSTA